MFQPLERKVSPLLEAIEEWVDGPLAPVMAPIKKRMYNIATQVVGINYFKFIAFEDNERPVVLSDDKNVSMNPSN